MHSLEDVGSDLILFDRAKKQVKKMAIAIRKGNTKVG